MNTVLLRKVILRLRLKWQLQKVLSNKYSSRTTRKRCEEYLELLNPSVFKAYVPATGLAMVISVRYKNIGEYTKKLTATNLLLKQEMLIRAEWDIVTERSLTVDRFLITSDGYYSDNVKAVSDFKAAGLELCKLMAKSDIAEFGIDEHNLRMLTKLFDNLLEVVIKLNIVSVE